MRATIDAIFNEELKSLVFTFAMFFAARLYPRHDLIFDFLTYFYWAFGGIALGILLGRRLGRNDYRRREPGGDFPRLGEEHIFAAFAVLCLFYTAFNFESHHDFDLLFSIFAIGAGLAHGIGAGRRLGWARAYYDDLDSE